jgi:hypothetical protein
MKKSILSIHDYNCIHGTAYRVLREVTEAEKFGMFFSIFGSFILNKYYKIPARPVAGAFALRISSGPEVICFGVKSKNGLESTVQGFHAWVETETHMIDFLAPLYLEAVADTGLIKKVPRKMMQKRIVDLFSAPTDIQSEGDVLCLPNAGLTERLITEFVNNTQYMDLLAVASACFGDRHSRGDGHCQMIDDLGEAFTLAAPTTKVVSSW